MTILFKEVKRNNIVKICFVQAVLSPCAVKKFGIYQYGFKDVL